MNKYLKTVLVAVVTIILPGLYGVSANSLKIKHDIVNKPASSTAAVVAAPAISYSSATQVYRAGTTITGFAPTNTGGAVPNSVYYQQKFLAGSATTGFTDGTGAAASFTSPRGYATDASGNIFIADGNLIRKITPAGVVSTFAGSVTPGYADGTGKNATFYGPMDIAIDAMGNLFVVDEYNYGIRKITPTGVVTRFAGSGVAKKVDGTGAGASFNFPQHIAIDPSGNLYVSENSNYIRKVTPAGVVTTINIGYAVVYDIAADKSGYLYIIAAFQKYNSNMVMAKMLPSTVESYSTLVYGVQSLTVSPAGDVYVSAVDTSYISKIYKVSSKGITATVNSNVPLGFDIGVDPSGNLISDDNHGTVYKIPTYGYGVSPALPPGLSISGTGVITGKPLIPFPATNFKVTAYNTGGSSNFIINITVKGTTDAPAITLPATATFTAGTAITSIKPTNTGGAIPAGVYGNVTTLAGNFTMGSVDGTGDAAQFAYPSGLACDLAGNIYIAENGGQRIRKITPAGVVTTLAGHSAIGYDNGPGNVATFYDPNDVAVDAAGNVYVADGGNNLIRKITPGGIVSTFAGNRNNLGGPDGTGARATFSAPGNIGIDYLQNLYVTESQHIRKITPEAIVTTPIPFTGFNRPYGIKADNQGNLYIADGGLNAIKKVSKTGAVTTLAGGGAAGAADGKGTSATFNSPHAVAVDDGGNIYVADFDNNEIRLVTPLGAVSTVAGITTAGKVNGVGTKAMFSQPAGVALDGKGHLYVSDFSNHVIRKVDVTGYSISPALPPGLFFNGSTGAITGTPTTAHSAATYTIAAHNGGGISIASIVISIDVAPPPAAPALNYPADGTYAVNAAIAPISANNTGGALPSPSQVLATTFAGNGTVGAVNGPANQASFKLPSGAICFDPLGNMYVADAGNNLIRKITPAGNVTTFAGSGAPGAINGTGTAASFKGINGIVADKTGNLFVCDALNNKIRKITPAGVVTTFAGSGTATSVNGTGTAASFTALKCIGIDKNDVLYVNDNGNIMAISPAAVVTNKTYGNFLPTVTGVAPDLNGNIYLALSDNYIKKIDAANQVTTFAGHGTAASDDGTGVNAAFNSPKGIIVDATTGNIFLADAGSNKIRMITPDAVVTTFAGNGLTPLVNGAPIASGFSNPLSIAFDKLHNLYIADAGHNVIRKIGTTGYRIAPLLPKGLSLNVTSGSITGTPTVVSPKTAYIVTAYNGGGTATDTLNITVIPAPAQKTAGLANTSFAVQADSLLSANAPQPVVNAGLSPNGDGVNDVLIISNITNYPANKLTIISRGGNKVFETSNYDNQSHTFDGRTKQGALQPQGTYFYQLEYTDGNLLKRKTGFIILKY